MGEGASRRDAKAKNSGSAQKPMDVTSRSSLPSLAIRLEQSYQDRIETIEADKRRSNEEVERLRDKLDNLAPENARLREALDAEKTYNLVSTLLNTIGSVFIGYATFTGKLSERIAALGLGLVVAAVVLQISGRIRHRSSLQKGS